MQGEDDDVDSGWAEEKPGKPIPAPAPPPKRPRKNTPVGGLLAPVSRDVERNETPAFGMLAPSGDPRGNKTPALGMLAAPPATEGSAKKTPAFGTVLSAVTPPPAPEFGFTGGRKTPVGGMQAPPMPFPDEPVAQPRHSKLNPDRATMPPPMPEAEYIERVLAMEDGELPVAPRRRLNTLVETDPLQYDEQVESAQGAAASKGETSRPTRRPVTAARAMRESFLDLELDPGEPRSLTPPTVRSDELDDLPVDEVIDSIPPRAYSTQPPAGSTARPAPAVVASSSAKRGPSTLKNPGAPRYDSSPEIQIEIEEPDHGPRAAPAPAPRFPAIPPPSPPPRDLGGITPPVPAASQVAPKQPHSPRAMPRGRGSARPPEATPAAGTAVFTAAARRTSPPAAAAPPSDPPTRAVRTPTGTNRALKPPERPLDKVVERFEAGDFGRALMLAEQAFDDDDGPEAQDLRHYAELCREKLRQTYLERIGSGRTILRVTDDAHTLRGRALDPRLAFLLSLLDGASTVDDVIDMSTMPALEAVRALHELMQEGVVEVVPPGRRRNAP